MGNGLEIQDVCGPHCTEKSPAQSPWWIHTSADDVCDGPAIDFPLRVDAGLRTEEEPSTTRHYEELAETLKHLMAHARKIRDDKVSVERVKALLKRNIPQRLMVGSRVVAREKVGKPTNPDFQATDPR